MLDLSRSGDSARLDVPIESMRIFAKTSPIGTKLRALVEGQGADSTGPYTFWPSGWRIYSESNSSRGERRSPFGDLPAMRSELR